MKDIELKILDIRNKLKELIDKHHSLVVENEELIEQLLKTKEENEQLLIRINELENNRLTLHLGSSLDNSEKERITNNIDKLLNEIDKSLELLKS